MPTRGILFDEQYPFLTAPKPDLCVSFQREDLIGVGAWDTMPPSTKKLVCFEGIGPPQDKRAFGFLVVEAKRSKYPPDDNVAKLQVLNDASQALHNMYEFFREARQEALFFEKVRFFSATASEQGIIVRIHRAVEIDTVHSGPRTKRPIFGYPHYNLEFRFEEYVSLVGEEFSRQRVIDVFERIMIGYGEGLLYGLLREAARAIDERFQSELYEKGNFPADVIYDYRHGQRQDPRTPSEVPQQTGGVGSSRRNPSANPIRRQASENAFNRARSISGNESATPVIESAGNVDSAMRSGPSSGTSFQFSSLAMQDPDGSHKRPGGADPRPTTGRASKRSKSGK